MKAVLFDMDGVVLDSMPWHVRAWQEAFERFGLAIPDRDIYLHEGAIELETAKEIFRKRGLEPSDEFFREAFRLQREIFCRKYRRFVRPFKEIPEILDELRRQGKRLALVTSSHAEVLREVLPRSLERLFDFVVTGDAVKRRKPHPDPYLKGLEGLGVEAEEAVAVENAPAGIRSAKAAGLKCVAITTTLEEDHLREADMVVFDHRHLKEVLKNGLLS